MHDRVERHFACPARGGRTTSAARCSPRWATASPPRSRRPRPRCRRRSRRSGRCRRSAFACGWGSTPARWSASATTSGVARSTARPASWRSATAGRSWCPTCPPRSCAPVRSPVELADLGTHRLRDLTEPERLWQVVHPDLEQQFPPVRGLDTYSNNLPAAALVADRPRRDVARVIELVGAASHRHPHRRGRRRQDPAGRAGRGRPAAAVRQRLVRRAGQRGRPRRRRRRDRAHHAACGAVTDPLAAAAAMLAGEDTLLVVDNCEHVVDSAAAVIDALTAECPSLSVIATSREALGIDGEHVVAVAVARPGDHGRRAVPSSGPSRPAPTSTRWSVRWSSTSAAGSTASRSPSSWPRPGPRRSGCRRSSAPSTTGSAC